MMADWRGGDRIGRHLLLFKVLDKIALIFIILCISVLTATYAQPGFLSIDCGYIGLNYTDPNTTLTWTGDSGSYINVGETYGQPANAVSQWLQSFRFFPEPRNKYCYELPTMINSSYLLRASFYLNETSLKERRPFQFILYLDATNWFTLTSGDDSISNLLAVEEVIFTPPNNITNFCILPVIGVPFISSLELRELPKTMYNYSGNDGEYLALLFRYNLGANESTPSVRFPDDKFDRIWQPAATPLSNSGLTVISTTTPPDNKTRANANFVPPNVMKDAWVETGVSLSATAVFTLYSLYLPVYLTPSEYAVAVIYTEHLNSTDSNLYNLSVYFNDAEASGNFSDQATMYELQQISVQANFIDVTLDLDQLLQDGPTLNAIEVYGQYTYNFSSTGSADIAAITALKTSLNLDDWQGDPCTPVPDDWFSCDTLNSLDYVYSYPDNYNTVEKPCSLNGTATTYCAEDLDSTTQISWVSSLNIHNLSNVNTGLSLFINISLYYEYQFLSSLENLSITQSEVTSEIFQNVVGMFVESSVSTMDWSYNAIDYINASNLAGNLFSLTSLNLSHNQIRVMDTFTGIPLEILDVSYNKLTSLSGIWNNSAMTFLDLSHNQLTSLPALSNNSAMTFLDLSHNQLTSLPALWNNPAMTFLDLSHNQLQGQISSLDKIIQVSNKSLHELNIASNNLEGSFSSPLYFSDLRNLTKGIFDQNTIQGTLDLSIWYDSLQKAAGSQNSSTNIVATQLFSFVNNSISDISPNAETIKPVIDMVTKKYNNSLSFGILLGGNPYCNSAKSYAQQYLCRFTIYESIPEPHDSHNDRKIILIVAISGGIIALLLTSITSASVWKLWKQVRSLRAIQQALADRKVQPPFYQYSDLKQATKDFHKDNTLGHGGFGIVYKGVLGDDTKLAVKKLFASKGSRAGDDLDEFLNEVVLITGIKHRNLVHLKGCCIKDKQRMLVYEYVENGNLAEALWGSKAHGVLDWGQRYTICMGVARGLSYLHDELQPSIIHRDIKPENILLDTKFRPKVADFGLARHSSNETSAAHYTLNIAGTLGYFSPEYATEGQLSDKADVYSYGIVVLEVMSGRKCIDHSLPQEKVFLKDWVQRMYKEGMMLDVLQHELRDNCVVEEVMRTIKIALLCVQNSPRSRPAMSEVVAMLMGSGDIQELVDESTHSPNSSPQGIMDVLESEERHILS